MRMSALALVILTLFPATLHARQGGFVDNVNPGFVGRINPGFVTAPGGALGPAPRPLLSGQRDPAFSHGPQPPAWIDPTTPLPAGISVSTPRHSGSRSPYVPAESHISVAQPRVSDTPGARITSHPSASGPGNGVPRYTPRRPGAGTAGFGHLFPAYPPPEPLHPTFRVVLGMPRADVFLHMGNPTATIRSPGRETLVFNEQTVVIEDGVVAVIR